MPDTADLLDKALQELRALHPKKIDLGLERIERVLEALGRPQDRLPPVIHIAGTNGKGSVVAYLRAFAEAAGLKAHVYTSPHLVHFRERIVVASQDIDDIPLIDVLSRVRRANDGLALSFFEATTAAALLAFSEMPADICLIEVGLGGRYDATNVIAHPACAGITPIDYDHAEFLGRDLAGIAREKAGIIKKDSPVFSGLQSDQVNAVLDSEARKAGADIKQWGQDFRSYRQQGRLVYEDAGELLDLPLPALPGDHQVQNAGLAIAIARAVHLPLWAIEKGISAVKWPARLQHLTTGVLTKRAHEAGAELWLDGGHNPAAARAVSRAMAELDSRAPRPLILITGILANKDIGGFLDEFEGLASAIISLDITDHASLAPETLIEIAASRNIPGQIAVDLEDAVKQALNLAVALSRQPADRPANPPRILICGSLYLAGEVLKFNS